MSFLNDSVKSRAVRVTFSSQLMSHQNSTGIFSISGLPGDGSVPFATFSEFPHPLERSEDDAPLPKITDIVAWREKFAESWEHGAGKRLRVHRPRGSHSTLAFCLQCKRVAGQPQWTSFWNVHSPRVCREAQRNPPPDEDCSYTAQSCRLTRRTEHQHSALKLRTHFRCLCSS